MYYVNTIRLNFENFFHGKAVEMLTICTSLWCFLNILTSGCVLSLLYEQKTSYTGDILSQLCGDYLCSETTLTSELEFVNLLRSQGIDSKPCGPVRQPYLTYRPARLHGLAESVPWNRFPGSLDVCKYKYSQFAYFRQKVQHVRYREWGRCLVHYCTLAYYNCAGLCGTAPVTLNGIIPCL
jgi:hypothetical protein